MSTPLGSVARVSTRGRRWMPLVGLMALSAAVQIVCFARCETIAGDAVKVVHTARKIDELGWAAACEATDHQPLFPGWVWCVRHALALIVGDSPGLWATAVQLAAAIPLVLAVAPFVALNTRWHGRRVGLAAGALFAVLPAAARLGPQGLADALHLFAFVVCCTLLERLLADEPKPRASLALACGAALGAACLVRLEGLLLVGALAVAWAVSDWRREGKPLIKKRLPTTLAIAAGTLAVLAPFSLATGRWVQKYSWPSALVAAAPASPAAEASAATNDRSAEPPVWQRADGSTLALPYKDDRRTGRRFGLTLPIEHFCGELAETLAYLFGLLAAGRLCFSPRTRRPAFDVLAVAFGVAYAAVAIVHAGRMGYLSERHLLPLAVFLLGWSARGALDLGAWWARRERLRRGDRIPRDDRRRTTRFAWATLAGCAASVTYLTFLPIQPQFAAVRDAAAWIAERCPPDGRVLDTHEMTSVYSGRATYGFDAAATAFADPRLTFVVVAPWELSSGSRRAEELALFLRAAGEPAAVFRPARIHRRADRETIEIYRWRPERLTQAGLVPLRR